MSDFPMDERADLKRYSDATATEKYDMERPLAFMSPAERYRMYRECIAPMEAQLVRIYATSPLAPFLALRKGDSYEIMPREPFLEGAMKELADLLIVEIGRVRAQILGGLT